ncbi:hypothetical protein AKO63_1472 [Escherichia coli]|nr:hypothetical protein AKO63_1472 [Escherichia coli]
MTENWSNISQQSTAANIHHACQQTQTYAIAFWRGVMVK